MSARSVASDALTLDVRDAAHAVAQSTAGGPWQLLGQLLRRIRDHQKNRVLGHVRALDPTTASTQLTGSTGVTEVRVNLPSMTVCVNGTQKEFAAEADRVLHDTTVYTGSGSTTLTSGKSAIITIVAENAAGTVALKNIKGATATTGAQVAPTDTIIAAGCTSGAAWVKLFNVTINRTGDTTITQSQDSTVQPTLGINQDEDFFQGFTD
jgi:hypothetical protein